MPKIVDHPARRREISSIAAALIAEEGMEAATIREIAQRSGYSKGVIEHYFENKDELISGALDWINDRYEQRVAKATADLAGLASLRKRIEVTLPMNRAIRDEWKVRLVFWSIAAVQDNLRAPQRQRFERAVEFYAGDIAQAIEHGDIRANGDASQLGYWLFTATIGISSVALYDPSRFNKAFLLGETEHLIDRLIRGL